MKVKIAIDCDNAAFDESPSIEVARILRQLADKIDRCGLGYNKIYDVNGNHAGDFDLETQDDD